MFRYEQKYLIHPYRYEEIKRVLMVLAEHDANAGPDGEYMIRSLYFDDMYNAAYNEKADGVYSRKKYRIRIYNCQKDVINLECKYKEGAYIKKEMQALTYDEYEQIMAGEYGFLLKKDSQLAKEFFVDVRTRLLKPSVIVDYERESFVYDAGNVRITFDKNVRACEAGQDIFDRNIPSYNVFGTEEMIMEIKFTEYLPERIQQIFKLGKMTQTSASKYCLCVDRIAGIR